MNTFIVFDLETNGIGTFDHQLKLLHNWHLLNLNQMEV